MKKLIFTLIAIFALGFTSCTSTSTDTELIELADTEQIDESSLFETDPEIDAEIEKAFREYTRKWFQFNRRVKTEVVYNVEYLSSFGTKRNNVLLTDTIESAYSIKVIGYEYTYYPDLGVFDRCDWISYRYCYDNERHLHSIEKMNGIEPTNVTIVSVRELEYKDYNYNDMLGQIK